ncbi:MAG: hypothetical protein JRJ56_07015 [Deltaproteobacteria bacterium]|nr:hypothetical protein [Deltaproteobacteria bacterium]
MIRDLSWGRFQPCAIRDIDGDQAFSRTRQFIAAIHLDRRGKLFDVYLCADQRNGAIRNLLYQFGDIREFSNAGNVVYAPSQRPGIVIAHGPDCGAVTYARRTRGDAEHQFPHISRYVDDDPLSNAYRQLHKIPREFRAGIIYFDHARGTVDQYIEDGDGRLFRHFAVCEFIFRELQVALAQRFPKAQLASFAREQNPDFTLLCHPEIRPHGFNYFEVNLQRHGRFHGIIRDSLLYAVSHALTGPAGSFSATRAVIMAFHHDMEMPPELFSDFFEADRQALAAYLERGGSIYLLKIGNLPSEKKVYRLQPRAAG